MIKQTIFLLLIFFGLGCQPMKSIIGEYSSKSINTMASHTLELKKDSTFNYFLTGDLSDQKSTGFWSTMENGNIVLKSDESIRLGVIEAKEESLPSKEVIQIKVVDEFDNPLSFASVVLNDDPKMGFNLDEYGQAIYGLVKIKSMSINYLGTAYNYNIDSVNVNSILLKIRLQDELSLFFDNEIWEVNGSKLTNDSKLVLIKRRK